MQVQRPDNLGPETAIIILAAGGSSRMGSPKQLLDMGGITLIRNMAVEAVSAAVGPVILVAGAYADEVAMQVSGLDIICLHNQSWQEGLSSSVRCGVRYVLDAYPKANAVILMLGDQPYVDANLLRSIANLSLQKQAAIVTCDYGSNTGPPSLFVRKYFADLMSLTGNEGAKKVVQLHSAVAEYVHFPMGKFDLDTPEDYEAFRDSAGLNV